MQRGVGRGLAATKPAWMTQGSSSLASTIGGLKESSPEKSKSSSNRREDSNGRWQDRSRSRSRSHDRLGRRRSSSSDRREDKRLGTGRSTRGSKASTRRLDARDDDRYPKSSGSRSPSGSRHGSRRNGDNGREATRNGDSYRERVARELEATTGLRVGGLQIGRGRGRGLTLPAWMSHPKGISGSLQQSDVGGDRQELRQPSPKRFRGRSPAPASPDPPAGGGHGGAWEGRGGGRSSGRAGGRYGSPRGGRDGGRSNGRMREKLPENFSIHKGEVVKTEAFGAFVKLDGYRKHGLVHCSRMAAYRVEDVTDICKVGDRVYVKVIEAIDADDVREQRIGLSMKLVDQSSGVDLDPSNAEAETEAQRHRSRGAHGERPPVKPDAVFNTTCTKCGGHGHMSIDCFSRDGQKYELVPEEDPSDAAVAVVSNGGGGGAMRGVHREAPHRSAAAIGRGKQATMPAWMTDLGLNEKLNKKNHRKEKKSKKKSDRKHDRDHKSGGSKDGSRRKDSDGSDSDGDRSDDSHKKHRHRHKHKKTKHKKSKHGKQDRRHSEDKGERRDEGDRDQSVGRRHRESASGRDAKRRRDDSRRRNVSPDVGRRRRSYSRGRGRGESRDTGGGGRRRDEARRGLGGGRDYHRECRLGDAQRGEVEDGGRWKPRADSDRSESRSTR